MSSPPSPTPSAAPPPAEPPAAAEPVPSVSLAVSQMEEAQMHAQMQAQMQESQMEEGPPQRGPEVLLELEERRRQLTQRQSSIWTRRQQAVCVRRAFKRYGTKKQPNVILDGLNMTVPKGIIYGLLGASGCGKTTLLSCIVGRRRLNSGEIWVLGGRPGSRGSGVPGPRIGYMPQELALYQEFTIHETLVYFGWINNLTTKEVETKEEFLLNFLMLPPSNRIIKTLSGGQIRRVSFAAALIHDPELLILDEPTVGVDPLLRQSIWDHLVNITKEGNKTVIITTHYIDETRQAHSIGLMRGGRFLAEESPTDLLAKHNCESLEDVFLKLSKIQNIGKRRRSSFMQEVMSDIQPDEPVSYDVNSEISGEYGDNVSLSNRDVEVVSTHEVHDLPPEEETQFNLKYYLQFTSRNKMKALLWKNFLWIVRNMSVFLFVIGLPIFETALFCLSIGQDPKGLHIGIVNHELNDSSDDCIDASGCNYDRLSCRYLQHFRKRPFILERYDSDDDAKLAVEKGYAWAAIAFESNYSASLWERITDGRAASDEAIDFGQLKVDMDMSNQHIGQMLRRDMILTFQEFAIDLLKACNFSAHAASNPIRFNTPIYGTIDLDFRDFAAPGVILTIIFILCVAQTSLTMMTERKEGMLERCLVSGVTPSEILLSHLITQCCLMIIQAAIILLFSFAVFRLSCEGNFLWIILLTICTGMCGMCYGFFVSCICDTERSGSYIGLGSFIPVVMLCGIIWPTEGMHPYLKYLSFVMPLTQSTEALRTVIARGWSASNPMVYYGFVSTFIWIMFLLIITVLTLKFKKG